VSERLVPGIADDLFFAGLYGGTANEDEPVNVEGYVLLYSDHANLAGETGLGSTEFTTVGARLFGAAEILDYAVEAAYQHGRVRGDSHRAYALAARAGVMLRDVELRPRIEFEVDHASGDKDPVDGDSRTFQTLFPTNHRHYGHADLMAWMNMWDIRLGASVHASEDIKIGLDYHHLRLANPKGGWYNAGGQLIRTGVTGDSRHLGDEFDLTVQFKPWKPLTILLGWAHMFKAGFIRDTGGGSDADLMYLQSHVRF